MVHDVGNQRSQEMFRAIQSTISNDFLGHLKDLNAEAKKVKVLDIYRFLYRFSLEKVRLFIDNPSFMIICLSYFMDTKMLRIHQRQILARNADKYYRVFENLINTSRLQNVIL